MDGNLGGADAGQREDIAATLSPAEHRVAVAVATGATNKAVATQLFISVKTVDYHLQNIYRKLGARSRTELAVLMAGVLEGSLSEDEMRFLASLADQPAVSRIGVNLPGTYDIDLSDVADETGD